MTKDAPFHLRCSLSLPVCLSVFSEDAGSPVSTRDELPVQLPQVSVVTTVCGFLLQLHRQLRPADQWQKEPSGALLPVACAESQSRCSGWDFVCLVHRRSPYHQQVL